MTEISNSAKELKNKHRLRQSIVNELNESLAKWREGAKVLEKLSKHIDNLHERLNKVDYDIRVETTLLTTHIDGLDLTPADIFNLDNEIIQDYPSNGEYLMMQEEIVVRYLKNNTCDDEATAGQIFNNHKSKFKNTREVTSVLKGLIEKGYIERVPTQKGMKVKLVNFPKYLDD